MGTDISLVSSMTPQIQQQKSSSQPNPNTTTTTQSSSPYMWNPKQHQEEKEEEDEDSWEVRAFAEDTRNIMNTTWPPRSYSCTFCRRDFRSAQALGGHMNVHRRDRARRLHQNQPPPPPQDLVANSGLCLLYHLPNPNINSNNNNINIIEESPSTHLSISSPNNFMMQMQNCSPSFNFQVANSARNMMNNSKMELQSAICTSFDENGHQIEELDLELRLGHKPTPT